MIKLGKTFKFLAHNIYGALFKSAFYRQAVNYKVSKVLISFFLALLVAYSLPLVNIYSKIFSIDLINPENSISKKIEHFIQQVPDFSIVDGKIQINDEGAIEIQDYQSKELLVVFNKIDAKQKEGAIFFGPEGVFIKESALKSYIINLFDLPYNDLMQKNKAPKYEYLSYSSFENIDVSSSIIRSSITSMVQTYDIKYYLMISAYFVLANFALLMAQIIIFTFLAISVLGTRKLRYRNVFVLTATAFIPYFILEVINIVTYKQSYLLNSYPYSFIIFVVINSYFVRFASLSIRGQKQ
ncbi:MAG: DUF1189 family protein [Rickettsiales bacterium]|jgi:hypothetical protein|nr:DUF1189 family protein [Rickettsiales bacterium]